MIVKIAKILCTTLILTTSFTALNAADLDLANQALDEGDYKEAISLYQEAIKQAPKDKKGELKANLALAYYRDQEDEKAFKTYLEALRLAPKLTPPPVSQEERALYEQAQKLYVENTGPAAHEVANTIRQNYSAILALHPDYYLLNFIVAAAYANLGMFDEFFERFYRSYEYYPESYMAYKTQAILHVKLFEKTPKGPEQESERQQVFETAKLANERNPNDTSLYRILISFSPNQDHQAMLIDTLKKIINENRIIPRTDILFYVKEAVDAKQYDLAQQFVDKAGQWYSYSRVLQTAQDYVNEHRKS